MSQRFIIGCCSAAALIAGCSVGPNYHPAKVTLPGEWAEAGAGGTTNREPSSVLAEWWRTFSDPQLDALIERATLDNQDLKAATARLRGVRALRGAVVADFLPTIDANASYTTARRSENALAFPVRLIDTQIYQIGFDATWEIDIFGGKRRSLESANAELQAAGEERRNVLVSVLAEVARNYMELRGAQRRLEIAGENLRAQQDVLEIAQQRLRAGLGSDLEVAQAGAVLAATRSEVPTLETLEKLLIHRLSVLLGQPPAALQAELQTKSPIPPVPPEVPAGLPSDLLRRRPDVRRSERQLASATARIGVTVAELFPKFFLTGSAGFQSLETANLLSPGSQYWSAGPSVRWRLLEYPRLRAQIRAQTAAQEEALAQFHQTVLLSLEEVENALVSYTKEKVRYTSLTEEVAADRRALELSTQTYQAGLGDFLNVLVAERALYQAEDDLIQSQRAVSVYLVALYKALGGGWETEANANPDAAKATNTAQQIDTKSRGESRIANRE